MNCDSEWNEKLASNAETHRGGNGVMQCSIQEAVFHG